jgi:MFS family permease
MAGVLVTSIASGNLISRTGRYRAFPIIGTGLAAIAIFLLSRLGVSTPIWLAALYMLVLGLGLGMVMQVLVLAAQNAVSYQLLGVATSGSTLFRQIGGSIGVSIFGAIFANRLATELANRLPRGVHVPSAANPAVVQHLPAAIKQPYIEAFTAAIQPVFLAATGFAIAAFLLTWLLREVPLRTTAPAEGIGESFASPREARSDHELERIISAIAAGPMRTDIYRRIVVTSGLDLTPAQAWLLGRIATEGRIEGLGAPRAAPEEVALLTAQVIERGYLTVDLERDRIELSDTGSGVYEKLVEAGRAELMHLVADTQAPDGEIDDILRRIAASLLADMPRDGNKSVRRREATQASPPSG